jgi:hypothetical protein
VTLQATPQHVYRTDTPGGLIEVRDHFVEMRASYTKFAAEDRADGKAEAADGWLRKAAEAQAHIDAIDRAPVPSAPRAPHPESLAGLQAKAVAAQQRADELEAKLPKAQDARTDAHDARREDAETRLQKRATEAWRKPAPSISEPAPAAPAKQPLIKGNERRDASPIERAKDAWKRKGDL